MADVTAFVLPEAFREKMKSLLGDEYGAFVRSYDSERVQGLRLNPLKGSREQELLKMPEEFRLKKIPWVKEGYYYDSQSRPGRHPYHEAGVYYIQEPSAMAVVELLAPKPGELVLDLCAAPGGKTTHIAGRLEGRGFLLSNEIHPARAKILSQNVERMGIGNAVVTNEDSGKLASYFPCFFDKIVVDAPCSGEGMFRKDEGAGQEWSPENVALCAGRQEEILDNAAVMLKGGGRLVYSTCTFSPEENEGSMETFLEKHPDFSVEKVCAYEGFEPGHPEWIRNGREALRNTYRIWPHKVEGEGHYLAVLKKEESLNIEKRSCPAYVRDKAVIKEFRAFADLALSGTGSREAWCERLVLFGDQLYVLPEAMTDLKGLKVIRPGLHLGTMKKNRFEPSHALALYLTKEQAAQWYDMKSESEQAERFLRGETLTAGADDSEVWKLSDKGWVLMLVDGFSIGWAKLVGTTLKNHYPKGLRR